MNKKEKAQLRRDIKRVKKACSPSCIAFSSLLGNYISKERDKLDNFPSSFKNSPSSIKISNQMNLLMEIGELDKELLDCLDLIEDKLSWI